MYVVRSYRKRASCALFCFVTRAAARSGEFVAIGCEDQRPEPAAAAALVSFCLVTGRPAAGQESVTILFALATVESHKTDLFVANFPSIEMATATRTRLRQIVTMELCA